MKMERCCDVSGKAPKNLFLGVFSSIIANGGRVYVKASSYSSFLHFPVLLFFFFFSSCGRWLLLLPRLFNGASHLSYRTGFQANEDVSL